MPNRLFCGCCGGDGCTIAELRAPCSSDGGHERCWTGWTDPPSVADDEVDADTTTSITVARPDAAWCVDIEVLDVNDSVGTRLYVETRVVATIVEVSGQFYVQSGYDCVLAALPSTGAFWLRVKESGDPRYGDGYEYTESQRNQNVEVWSGEPEQEGSSLIGTTINNGLTSIVAQKSLRVVAGAVASFTTGNIHIGRQDGFPVGAVLDCRNPLHPVGAFSLTLNGQAIATHGESLVRFGASSSTETSPSAQDPLTQTMVEPTFTIATANYVGNADYRLSADNEDLVLDLLAIKRKWPARMIVFQPDTDTTDPMADQSAYIRLDGRSDTGTFDAISYDFWITEGVTKCNRIERDELPSDVTITIETGVNSVSFGNVRLTDISEDESDDCPHVVECDVVVCSSFSSDVSFVTPTGPPKYAITGARIIYEDVIDEWINWDFSGSRYTLPNGPVAAANGGVRLELNNSALNGTYEAAIFDVAQQAFLSYAAQTDLINRVIAGDVLCDNTFAWRIPQIYYPARRTTSGRGAVPYSLTYFGPGGVFVDYMEPQARVFLDDLQQWSPGAFRVSVVPSFSSGSFGDRQSYLENPGYGQCRYTAVNTLFANSHPILTCNNTPTFQQDFNRAAQTIVNTGFTNTSRQFPGFHHPRFGIPYTVTQTVSAQRDRKRWEFDYVELSTV